MLVLTRKVGEKIRIGDQVTVTIMEVKGRQVRLGIDAPQDLSVHRQEIYEKIQEENQAAACWSPADLQKVVDLWKRPKEA